MEKLYINEENSLVWLTPEETCCYDVEW